MFCGFSVMHQWCSDLREAAALSKLWLLFYPAPEPKMAGEQRDDQLHSEEAPYSGARGAAMPLLNG
jgi:hypothetical protein